VPHATPDPLLDENARAWLLAHVLDAEQAAGVEPSRERAEQWVAQSTTVGRRLSSLRATDLGDVLFDLEAKGNPAAVACRLAPWIARGAPQPRPSLPPLTADKRRHARELRRKLDTELLGAGLRPQLAPEPPTQAEREAFRARERDARHRGAERAARLQRRSEQAQRPIVVAGFDETVVKVLVAAIFCGREIRDEHTVTADELRIALERLRHLDPPRWEALRAFAVSLKPDARGEVYLRLCVEWLIACTPAAHREAERVIGEPLPEVLVDAPVDHGKPRYAPTRPVEHDPTRDVMEVLRERLLAA
jgi:hypothetical protein